MNQQMTPTRQGQICKFIVPLDVERDYEAYVLTDDPSQMSDEDTIHVVSISDLQRNIRNPNLATRIPAMKKDLFVIAEDLESYVASFNEQ